MVCLYLPEVVLPAPWVPHRIPTVSRPCGASISPRDSSPRKTIAVLERAATNPTNSDTSSGRSKSRAMAKAATIVSPTCSSPLTTIGRQSLRSFSKDNSRPIPKSSRAAPISAKASTCLTSLTRPRLSGPANIPANIKAAIGGILRRWRRATTATAIVRMTTRSRRYTRSCIANVSVLTINSLTHRYQTSW